MLALVTLPFGAAIGSFLNVVAHRLPRHESLVRPASRCVRCETPIRPYDNVPVLSWLLLRGSCRTCGERISPRYPLVEAATAALFVACALVFNTWWELSLSLVLVTALVTITLTDLDFRIIPNKVLLVAGVAGLAIVAAGDPGSLQERLIAAAAGGVPLAVISLAHPRGMGMGDAKLLAVLGLFLGSAVAAGALIGFAVGALAGVVIVARQGRNARKQALPFGPFLALGALVALFAGDALVQAYLDAFMGSS